jgi:hypothetical protein
MAGIIAFPQVVQEALQDFGDLFANEPQRRHFAEYLTRGNTRRSDTVSTPSLPARRTRPASTASFTSKPGTCRPSTSRLTCCGKAPTPSTATTAPSPRINTLIDHSGKLIDDVGWFWDHALVLAWLDCSALQRGHCGGRRTNAYITATPTLRTTPPSPHEATFWWSHLGWMLSQDNDLEYLKYF